MAKKQKRITEADLEAAIKRAREEATFRATAKEQERAQEQADLKIVGQFCQAVSMIALPLNAVLVAEVINDSGDFIGSRIPVAQLKELAVIVRRLLRGRL
jgi:hypothetical protein